MNKFRFFIKIVLPFILVGLFGINSFAGNICKTDKFGNNICDLARKVADTLSGNLPAKMNQNLTLQQVLAIKNMVKSTIILSYDRSYLESFLEQNEGTVEDIKAKMKKATVARMCKEGSQSELFINSGGQIQHDYLYSDMFPFMTINIKTCDPNWYDSSSWVKGLTEEEQVAVISLMRNELMNHLEMLSQHESNHDSEGQTWMLLINGIAHQMMASLATNSQEMQLALRDEARVVFDFGKGKIKYAVYTQSMEKIRLRRIKLLETLPIADVTQAALDFKDRARQLGETLIVYSKLSANKKMESD